MFSRSLQIACLLVMACTLIPGVSAGIEILDADPELSKRFSGRLNTDEQFGSEHFSQAQSYSHLLGSIYYKYSKESVLVFGFRVTDPFLHAWKEQGTARFVFSIIEFREGDVRKICPIRIQRLAPAPSAAQAAAGPAQQELGRISRETLEKNRLYSYPLDFQETLKPGDVIWIGLDASIPLDPEDHNLIVAGDLSSYPGGSSPMLIAGSPDAASCAVHGISLLQSLNRIFYTPRMAGEEPPLPPEVPPWINPLKTEQKINTLAMIRQTLLQELYKVPTYPIRVPDRYKGFHSSVKPDHEGWELRFLLTRRTTSITLYPALKQNEKKLSAYAFPKRFIITAYPRDGSAPVPVADWSQTDFPQPGLSPVIFPIPWNNYSEVRLKVLKGVPVPNGHTFALSEVSFPRCYSTWPIVPVATEESLEAPPYWSAQYMTDGRTAFGSPTPSARDASSGTFQADSGSRESVQLIIREEKKTLWDSFEFHPTQHPDDLPPEGFPGHIRVEFSNRDDFSTILRTESTREAIRMPDGRFPYVLCFQKVDARCVRITLDPVPGTAPQHPLQLEEITFNGGLPLLMQEWFVLKRSISGTPGTEALYDRIINGITWDPPVRRSANLIRRDTLLDELHQVEGSMQAIRQSHLRTVTSLKAGAIILASSLAGLFIVLQRRQSRKAHHRIRHRIQQDLHDEIGSQLSTISMITNFNKNAPGLPQELRTELADANQCAREAIASLAEVIWLTDKEILTLDQCFDVMKKRAEKMVHTRKLHLHFPQNIPTLKLSFRTKRNLILLFTEALNNSLKHSSADTIRVLAGINVHRQLILTVADNGHGFEPDTVEAGIGLESMRERAHKLGGSLDITSSPQQGTTVQFIGKI